MAPGADADRARLIAPDLPPSGAWEIASRRRADPKGVAQRDDFEHGAPAELTEGSIYTLDPFTGAVHLVDVPYAQLVGEPSACAIQAEAARVVGTHPSSTLPASGRPVIGLFSIGQCGSTLLARILTAAGAQVLNELDAFSAIGQVSRRWPEDPVVQAQLTAMAHGVVGHVARGAPAGPLALKFRRPAMQAAYAICAAGVRPILLTRSFDDWARSNTGVPLEDRIDALRRVIEDMAALPERPVILDYDRLHADPLAAAEACLGPVPADRHAAIRACLDRHGQAAADTSDVQRAREIWAQQADPEALRALGLASDLTLLTERA